MIEAVIFDFDGVILDSEPLHYQACSQVLKTIGINISYINYLDLYVGLSDKEMIPQILRDHNYLLTDQEIAALINKKIITYIDILHNSNELPITAGLEEFIVDCSKHIDKIAICSGSTYSEITAALTKLAQGSLTNYFKHIVTINDLTHGKPSPEGYLLTASRLNVNPKNCLVIEDSPQGVTAGKAAGMHVIALTTTQRTKLLSHADQIIENFKFLKISTKHENQFPTLQLKGFNQGLISIIKN